MIDRIERAIQDYEQGLAANRGNRITNELLTGLATQARKLVDDVMFIIMPESAPAARETEEKLIADQDAEIRRLLKDDEPSITLFMKVIQLAHAFDDLYDRDKPVDIRAMNQLVWDSLVGLRDSPAFAAQEEGISNVLKVAILNWIAANDMERGGNEAELRISHVIRVSGGEIIYLLMIKLGGFQWASDNARAARLLVQQDLHEWPHYRDEHLKGQS